MQRMFFFSVERHLYFELLLQDRSHCWPIVCHTSTNLQSKQEMSSKSFLYLQTPSVCFPNIWEVKSRHLLMSKSRYCTDAAYFLRDTRSLFYNEICLRKKTEKKKRGTQRICLMVKIYLICISFWGSLPSHGERSVERKRKWNTAPPIDFSFKKYILFVSFLRFEHTLVFSTPSLTFGIKQTVFAAVLVRFLYVNDLKTGNLFWCEVINNASVELPNIAYVLMCKCGRSKG